MARNAADKAVMEASFFLDELFIVITIMFTTKDTDFVAVQRIAKRESALGFGKLVIVRDCL